MAQAKTIQLLRSSSLYASLAAAKTALQAEDFITARSDGELVLARYTHTTGEGQEATTTIKSVIGVYHKAPNLPEGSAAGVTFIEDVTSAAGSAAALQAEIDRIESNVGLSTEGAYAGYSNDPVAGTSTTLKATVDNIINYIKGLDVNARANATTDGNVVVTVSQTDGEVAETTAALTDVVMGGYSKTSDTGAIAATDTLEQAFSKVENNIAKNAVSSEDGSIAIDTNGTTTDLSVSIDETTIVRSNAGALSANLTVAKLTTTEVTALSDANVKEAYKLIYATDTNRTAIGDVVKIYKDSALQNVYMGHMDDTLSGQDTTTHESSSSTVVSGTGDDALCFVYQLANGNYKLEAVNVQAFLKETEFKDGLTVDTSNHTVSVKVGNGLELGTAASDGNKPVQVKIDSTSEKDSQSTPVDFLSVSSNGVKVSGIKDEIDRKIAALDVTDTAVAGQYVSAVNETDGKVAMTRANVSEAVLNNYAKGTAPASLDIAATDTINQAIAKLEHQIDDVNAGVANLDAEVTSTDGTNVQVKVTEVDGVITAVNVTTDNTINSTDLSTAIGGLDGSATATAANGNVYSVLTSVTETDGVISKGGEVTLAAVAKTGAAEDVSVAADASSGLAAGNVQDTLEALTTATSNGLESVSSGNAAIAVGTKTNKDQSISLVLDTTTANGNITSDMLQITSNGLMMKDTWDCGTF